jgi:hypothetical protein
MKMTVTWGLGARRRALALLAAFGLTASLTTVLSPPALGDGNPPSVECSSTNPAWNGDFWKVEKDDGTLGEVETNVTGAITLAANGSWTNNNEDPVFRVVLKIDDGDDGDEESQVLSGIWETGEGGTIDLTLDGLDHVTFCSTSEVSEESEPTTTTTTIPTTTTTASPTTTTSAGPTTSTSPDASTTTTPAPDETATSASANSTDVTDSTLASDAAQANESGNEGNGSATEGSDWVGSEGSLPDADRDTTVLGLTNGESGEPPALGQASISSNPVSDVIRSSPHWLTLADLAILGALMAAIAVLTLIDRGRLDFRWLVEKVHLGKRWR